MEFVLEICLIVLAVVWSVEALSKFVITDDLQPRNFPGIDKSSGLTSDDCQVWYEGATDAFIYGRSDGDLVNFDIFASQGGTAFSIDIWTVLVYFYQYGANTAKWFRYYCHGHFGLASSQGPGFYGGNPWAVANRATAIGTYGVTVICAADGTELDVSRICDSVNDCPEFEGSGLGADEKVCDHDDVGFTNDAGIAITSTGKMVHIRNLCNGEQDTEDNSDEDESALLAVGLSCPVPPEGFKAFLRSPYFRTYLAEKRRKEKK